MTHFHISRSSQLLCALLIALICPTTCSRTWLPVHLAHRQASSSDCAVQCQQPRNSGFYGYYCCPGGSTCATDGNSGRAICVIQSTQPGTTATATTTAIVTSLVSFTSSSPMMTGSALSTNSTSNSTTTSASRYAPASSTSSPETSSSQGLSQPATIGIAAGVGGGAALAFLFITIWLCGCLRRRARRAADPTTPAPTTSEPFAFEPMTTATGTYTRIERNPTVTRRPQNDWDEVPQDSQYDLNGRNPWDVDPEQYGMYSRPSSRTQHRFREPTLPNVGMPPLREY